MNRVNRGTSVCSRWHSLQRGNNIDLVDGHGSDKFKCAVEHSRPLALNTLGRGVGPQ